MFANSIQKMEGSIGSEKVEKVLINLNKEPDRQTQIDEFRVAYNQANKSSINVDLDKNTDPS